MNTIIIGYIVSVVVGGIFTFFWSEFLHEKVKYHRTERDDDAERVWWIPLLIGIFERAIISTMIVYSVSGVAGFIGAWVGVKIAGGWSAWSKGTTYGRAVLFTGLLGSAMSILFGLLGGEIAIGNVLPTIAATTGVSIDLNILANMVIAGVAVFTLIYTARQVNGLTVQLKQTNSHTLTELSNQQNWALFDRATPDKDKLPSMLPSWNALDQVGWGWRVLILNHLNLLLLVFHESKVMSKSELSAWLSKGKYWFQNLCTTDPTYQQGREILKQILRPEEGYSKEFCTWLIENKIISADLFII